MNSSSPSLQNNKATKSCKQAADIAILAELASCRVDNQRKEWHQNEILFENVFIYKHISRHWLQ
jgi:hypothetical protein